MCCSQRFVILWTNNFQTFGCSSTLRVVLVFLFHVEWLKYFKQENSLVPSILLMWISSWIIFHAEICETLMNRWHFSEDSWLINNMNPWIIGNWSQYIPFKNPVLVHRRERFLLNLAKTSICIPYFCVYVECRPCLSYGIARRRWLRPWLPC